MKFIIALSFVASFSVFPEVGVAQQCQYGCADQPMPMNCPLTIDAGYVSARTYRVSGCESSITREYGEAGTTFCDATPPSGTVLIDFEAKEISNNNGSWNVTRLTKGANIDLVKKITEEYDSKIKAAQDSGDSKGAAELERMKKSHLEIVAKYSTNIDVVHLETYASGHGWDLDRKRGWMHVAVKLDVACVMPVNLGEQITRAVKDRATAVLVNNYDQARHWITTAVVADSQIPCTDANDAVSSIIDPNERGRRFEVKDGAKAYKLCVLLSDRQLKRPDEPTLPDFSKACEFKAGDLFEISAKTTYPCFVN